MQVFVRLQKLGLCLSPPGTLRLLDCLGDGHDEKIWEWRESLTARLQIAQVNCVLITCTNILTQKVHLV